MAELKTQMTRASATRFIHAIKDPSRRSDCKALVAMMTKATPRRPSSPNTPEADLGLGQEPAEEGHHALEVSDSLPRVFGLATRFKVVGTLSTILIAVAGFYLGLTTDSFLLRLVGAAMVAFGIAALLDVVVSKIVLDEDAIHIVSLARRRSYARAEFESVRVEDGSVVLRRRDGSGLVLPGTGQNALSVRNTIHAWISS